MKQKPESAKLEISEIIKRYSRAYDADKDNKALANEAKSFAAGEGQWPEEVRRAREADGNLCLTVNMCPSFIAQVANDIRMNAPAIKVVATHGGDGNGDKKEREKQAKKSASVMQSLVRHVETRSMAQKIAYARAAGDQVTCGYGAWRVKNEYASETSLLQELRIDPVQDAVGIVWSEGSYHPCRLDATECWVPVDYPKEDFKAKYPNASDSSFDTEPPDHAATIWSDWNTSDTIRVAEYWYKQREKAAFVSPDGASLIPADDEDAAPLIAAGAKIVERETTCVYRAVISATEVLEEPKKWPGRYIPIIPVFGPEIQIGAQRKRWGLIEHAKDAQRRVNFFVSAHAQAAAMQPKAPFIGTQKHFEGFENLWEKANTANLPFLPYQPDPQAPGGPQRSQPAIASQGYAEGIELALGDMKRIIGIYDAALGQKSNETSGKAILARQRESDVGSYEYAQNFFIGVQCTAKILLDLIPRIYDTQRTFRIIGEDGKVDSITINQVVSPEDAENQAAVAMINDISMGEYEATLDQGPSFTTKRDEFREMMGEMIRAYPPTMQIAGDVIAEANGAPATVVRRLRAAIPPQILEAEKQEEEGGEGMMRQQPPPVDPALMQQQAEQAMMAHQTAMADAQKSQSDAIKASADAERLRLSVEKEKVALVAAEQGAVIDLAAKRVDLIASFAKSGAEGVSPEQAIEEISGIIMGMQQQIAAISAALQPPEMMPPEMVPMEAQQAPFMG